MKCKKCGGDIPFFALKCNHCHKNTGYKLPDCCGITEDMFGQSVLKVPRDEDKNKARNRYLDTLPEYIHLNKIMGEKIPKRESFSTSVAKIFIILGIFFFLMFASFKVMDVVKSNTIKTIMPLLVAFIIIPIALIFSKGKKPKNKKKNKKYEKLIRVHDAKGTYYANQNVFGYIKYDHIEDCTRRVGDDYEIYYKRFYGYYEVEKKNIKHISYDPYFAEYIIKLYKPVYYDYAFEPTTEFRIQDVFDDTVLSNALERDLPPKNMRF